MNFWIRDLLLTTVIVSTAFPGAAISQIQLLNDEFENGLTLPANWLNINTVEGWGGAEHLEVHDIDSSAAGRLFMMPHTSSWFEDYKGTLLFKPAEGDFVFTTEVTATNRQDDDIPGSQYSLAGIMIRTPRNYPNGALNDWTSGGENYVFLSAGFASTGHPSCGGCPGPHFEVKNTINGTSILEVSSIDTAGQVQIRLARIDSAIIVLYRLPGEDWLVHRRFSRTDFPDEVQIGLVTYTDWDKVFTYDPFFHNSHVLDTTLNPDPSSNPGLDFDPDLIGQFEFVRFDSVAVPGFSGRNGFSDGNVGQ